MNAHLYAALDRAQELRAEAKRDREARAAQAKRPARRPFATLLALLRQPRLA